MRNLDSDDLWSLLLFSGYLKAIKVYKQEDQPWASLCIPNKEVFSAFQEMTQRHLQGELGSVSQVRELLIAFLSGKETKVHYLLSEMLKSKMSYHDVADELPERVYHAFLLGLLANLGNEYLVKSNLESGYGRYDIIILPKDRKKPGALLELRREIFIKF